MKNIKLILIAIIILASGFLGCVQKQAGTSTVIKRTVAEEPIIAPTVPTPTPTAARIPVVYKSDFDNIYGFTRIVSNAMETIPYDLYNRTLTINAGDTVIWINDADNPEEKLTIVSEQKLWDNTSAILRWRYKEFNYTFTQSGTYGVYIKEYPRILHQKIIVKP